MLFSQPYSHGGASPFPTPAATGLVKSLTVPKSFASPPESCTPYSWHPLRLTYTDGKLSLTDTWKASGVSSRRLNSRRHSSRRLASTAAANYDYAGAACPIPWMAGAKPTPTEANDQYAALVASSSVPSSPPALPQAALSVGVAKVGVDILIAAGVVGGMVVCMGIGYYKRRYDRANNQLARLLSEQQNKASAEVSSKGDIEIQAAST